MTAHVIEGGKLIAAVRDVAEQDPGWRSEGRYFDQDGQPVCLIGHALDMLGVQARDIEHFDDEPFHVLVSGCLPNVRFDVSDMDGLWLGEAQAAQDDQVMWSHAVWRADSLFPRVALGRAL